MVGEEFSAETYESAITAAVKEADVVAAVSLLRRMAVAHPHQAERLLDAVQGQLDELARVREL